MTQRVQPSLHRRVIKVCGPIVDTSNSTIKFEHRIELCILSCQVSNVELRCKKLLGAQMKVLFLFDRSHRSPKF